ncbi:MAG: hypothetical protein DMF88_09540 [Acidobacteria bacterium]|nr:MAG: hypothetical protein DMF88_09540 [Acidobacteriota bacterium]
MNMPAWAEGVVDPAVRLESVNGVLRAALPGNDPAITFYRDAGGAHFQERSRVGYAMTTLDTSVYHGYLAGIRPADLNAVIVDVGGGDGRNALPWLEWGYRRLVVIDPAGAALERLRAAIAGRDPQWLDRVLLIEADARTLPLRSNVAARIFAIEALAYLNEDYGCGVRECARAMAADGRVLLADRDYEGALLTRLFYGGGIAGMLAQGDTRDVVDGNADCSVRSRCFTFDELTREIEHAGLRIVASYGVSAMSLVLGYLRNTGRITPEDDSRLPEVHRLLAALGREGAMRRSHVIIAEHAGA